MKWKTLFLILFCLFSILSYVYANKSLSIYEQTVVGTTHDNGVIKTYHDNYAAIGGAIGFGIIAAAALITFAITLKNEKSK